MEEVLLANSAFAAVSKVTTSKPVALDEIRTSNMERLKTDIGEFDRVVGGGLVPGSFVLVGGVPGVGKSTLVLQIAQKLSLANKRVLYISGEESLGQLGHRAARLGKFGKDFKAICETQYENIDSFFGKGEYDVVVVDSIQTMTTSEAASPAGSVVQVREVSSRFLQIAKRHDTVVILVGHVLKDGTLAGPRILEHMVDTVLYFDSNKQTDFKLLRTYKNRFGSTREVGIFDHHDSGLVSVADPSARFLGERRKGALGSVVTSSVEGSRVFLLEIQILVVRRPPSALGPSMAAPKSIGVQAGRVVLISAVVEKEFGSSLVSGPMYANCVGGIRVDDPGADLGICAAMISSAVELPVAGSSIFMGEIGLNGEVRSVSRVEARVREALELKLTNIYIPKTNMAAIKAVSVPAGTSIVGIDTVHDLVSDGVIPGVTSVLPGTRPRPAWSEDSEPKFFSDSLAEESTRQRTLQADDEPPSFAAAEPLSLPLSEGMLDDDFFTGEGQVDDGSPSSPFDTNSRR